MSYNFAFQSSQHRAKTEPGASGSSNQGQPTFLHKSELHNGGVGTFAASHLYVPQVKEEFVKTDLEKQADVLEFLKNREDRRPARAAEILDATGINLDAEDEAAVRRMLGSNPKVEITEEDGKPEEALFVYYAKYNVSDRRELLHLINRCTNGINSAELYDTYPGVRDDIDELIRGGKIIGVKHKEHRTVLLYPRGEIFLTKLLGSVAVKPGDHRALCTYRQDAELKRGEAIRIGNAWLRVNSEIHGGGESAFARSQPSESVTNDKEPSARTIYRYTFWEQAWEQKHDPEDESKGKTWIIPLHTFYPRSEPAYEGPAVRHGCTQTVRSLWAESLQYVPQERDELTKLLVQKGLVSRSRAAGLLKQKKRRMMQAPAKRATMGEKKKRKTAILASTKLTNEHLKNTPIGRLMEEARMNPEKFNL